MPEPLLPFPPTLESPLVRAWFFDEGPTVVDQVLSPEMNEDAARFLTGAFQSAVNARYVNAGRKVRYVHDWSACNAYTVQARERLIQWGRDGNAGTAETIISISPNASPFVRIALATATLILRGLRMKVSVHESLAGLVTELSAATPVAPGTLK